MTTINQAAKILKKGGVVAYPTETSYGLAALASSKKGIERLFQIKGRASKKPISIIIDSVDELSRWATGIGRREKKIIDAFWPGPLTLVFKAKKGVPKALTAGTDRIAIRLSPHAVARRLARMAGGAITATSANRSGEASSFTPHSVKKKLGEYIDGIISTQSLSRSKGSTIIDTSGDQLKVIREGVIPSAKIISYIS